MTYGQGAGIFFIGYFILLSLEKFGASKWIARIMISWGLISGAFALLGGPTSLALAAAGRWRWCGRGRGS
jgi:MFS transporter, ACS family, tartrate transporter